jgi:SAM-dependent methyltransferase
VAALSPSTVAHLNRIAAFYDQADPLNWASKGYRKMLAHYYNLLIPADASVLEIGCGAGDLMGLLKVRRRAGVDLSQKQIARARSRVPDATFFVQSAEELDIDAKFDYIIISDAINFAGDIQAIFNRLHTVCHSNTRLILNFYNTLWRPLLAAARWSKLKSAQPDSNWLASSDVRELLNLTDWDVITIVPRILLPVKLLGCEFIFNRYLAPLLPFFCLTVFCVARSRPSRNSRTLTTSVIIPARNEAGNIEAVARRTPGIGSATELIFVEGHSEDNTWEAIQTVASAFPEKNIKFIQQPGSGKGDAVRAGFAAATGDILLILDADLTTPPEELPKFYDLIATGHAEFANGSRLVYPMEKKAMRFLNMCANKIFSLLFTWILGQHVKDTLCGTKAMMRDDYKRLLSNRSYFGEFDPFGDFDLLFGVAKLNLKISDVPIRYCQRTYGSTNIARWRHGWLLLRMTLFAARKLKFI